MRRYLIGWLPILAACSPQTELVGPTVPAELRQPCEASGREVDTLRDVALVLTDYAESLDCANGRILAIDEILSAYEAALEEGK